MSFTAKPLFLYCRHDKKIHLSIKQDINTMCHLYDPFLNLIYFNTKRVFFHTKSFVNI